MDTTKQGRRVSRRLTCTILSISLLTVMAGAAMAPALGVIREHFSECSPIMVQFIVSLPALFIIVTNLCFTSLCRLMKTRTLAIVGLVLYVASGAGAYFVDEIHLLLVFRALLGVSVGMVMPLSTGLLAYYFPPEEQSRLMGLSAAMNQLGGVVATFISGILATVSWNSAFLVYLLGFIALLLVVAFLPNESLVKASRDSEASVSASGDPASGQGSAGEENPFRLLRRFHPSVTGMLLLMLLFFIYPTNFAVTASSNPSMSVEAVTLVMVGLDVVAFLIGLLFGRLMGWFRVQMKYVAPVCFLVGYAFFSCGTSLALLLAGSAFVGIATGAGVPYLNTIASIKGGRNAATTVMPLISASLYLGQFLSPIVIGWTAHLFPGVTAPYKAGVIFALIYLVQTICTRNFQALPPASDR
ncbi:MAG: MFS transporter [Candidatus Cryptobacteroides sp.]